MAGQSFNVTEKNERYIPNDTTKDAIKEARNGNLERIENLDDWLKKLR